MADYDIAVGNPIRVGILVGDLLAIEPGAPFVRLRACDLRALSQRVGAVREAHPDIDVLVDVDVVVAADAAAARALLTTAKEAAQQGDTLRYVGTPTGLAGLLTDIHALGLADGVVLHPLCAGVAELIRERTMPALGAMGGAA
jgi:alkanesulfonate monooxygenase SsuD/methylene tetrahydromethanopterin reductase-like flavin-dependent oxidoreductase (luciferase family)